MEKRRGCAMGRFLKPLLHTIHHITWTWLRSSKKDSLPVALLVSHNFGTLYARMLYGVRNNGLRNRPMAKPLLFSNCPSHSSKPKQFSHSSKLARACFLGDTLKCCQHDLENRRIWSHFSSRASFPIDIVGNLVGGGQTWPMPWPQHSWSVTPFSFYNRSLFSDYCHIKS